MNEKICISCKKVIEGNYYALFDLPKVGTEIKIPYDQIEKATKGYVCDLCYLDEIES